VFPKPLRAIGIVLVAVSLAAAQGHDYTQADVDAGSRFYGIYCAGCHGAEGNTMATANLSRGTFRRAVTDDDLTRIILNGVPGTPMPPAAFKPEQVTQIVAFLRAFPSIRSRQTTAGDAARGKAIFEGKGDCLSCHRVNGRGGRTGPDLSDIGELRRPADIELSLLDPAAVIASQNRVVALVLRDGKTIRGRLLNQDTQSIQLLGPDEKPVSIARAAVQNLTDEKTSMPSIKDKLDARELADLVSYLATLKGLQ
jgi:putative heme-binding domain-containing protein